MDKIISWTAVILWMAVIFYFSHQPAAVSNELSTRVTETIAEKVEKIAPNMEFNAGSLNHTVRKNAHFFNFFVLGMLVMFALRRCGKFQGYRRIGIVLTICILYAVFDEVHQLFIPGRSAEIKDVLIDGAGASVGVIVYLVIRWIFRKRRTGYGVSG
ncbi:VanZ family protein [Bacillus sp. B15-48]|uniref:VanZ family protein n=1 Tax=Bacillus sp. B15-48 TaxID=1548601 RepID=UPI00193F0425|nr:VanZ family protein [Bacillus sp. B15-48]MBM4761372.1 VanZ family protein [Bacillus sp. B15-48]